MDEYDLHDIVSTKPDPGTSLPVVGEIVGIFDGMLKVNYTYSRWIHTEEIVKKVIPRPHQFSYEELKDYLGEQVDITDQDGHGLSGEVIGLSVERQKDGSFVYLLVTDYGTSWPVTEGTTIVVKETASE